MVKIRTFTLAINQGMICDTIFGQGNGNIREGVLNDFLHELVFHRAND